MDPQEITEALEHPGARNLALEFERSVRSIYDQMALIRIQPQWARFFDFGAGVTPRFLQTLASDA